jgi:hypothetical protein
MFRPFVLPTAVAAMVLAFAGLPASTPAQADPIPAERLPAGRTVVPPPVVPVLPRDPLFVPPMNRPSVVSPQSMPDLSGTPSPLDQEKAQIYRDRLRDQQRDLMLNNADRDAQGAQQLRSTTQELNRIDRLLQPR